MGLEAGSFPSDLVDTNPTGTDLKSQGDDHIRLIKRVIKTTFPNLNGAVTATPAQMNTLAAPGTVCFPGMIVMWSGAVGSIPAGWVLCNGTGTLSNGNPVPDLRNRFIAGAGDTYAVGATGGATTHTHTGSTSSSSVNVTIPIDGYGAVGGPMGSAAFGRMIVGSGGTEIAEILESLSRAAIPQVVTSTGHTHDVTVGSSSNLPPYFALAYIIKT